MKKNNNGKLGKWEIEKDENLKKCKNANKEEELKHRKRKKGKMKKWKKWRNIKKNEEQ